MDQYQNFIHLSRYSRWLEELGRRETWWETVERYMHTWRDMIDSETYADLWNAIYNHEIMPSMRAMWAAGPALERNNITGYNCSYLKVDTPRAFDEALYILSCGTGVGFSVEQADVNKLPIVNDHFEASGRTIAIEDSKEGWAKALRKAIADLYLGRTHDWDYSKIRPAGARLKTMGGRASGPGPLKDLLEFTESMFKRAAGRKLSPLECHDLMCKIGEIIVVGGVRRSAMISLSDLGNSEMAYAKAGQWYETNGQRALANNSAVYESKPDVVTFLSEWKALIVSQSGERGIYNRSGARLAAPERRNEDLIHGTNPCAEISLRSNQFCNLTEVVIREEDDAETIQNKVGLATILGTLQSTLTHFPYLRDVWRKNTEEERLLGVSLTGIQDNVLTQKPDADMLEVWRRHSVDTNRLWAGRIGVSPSTAITTIKPSGTVSQLVGSASGIHGRFAPFYIRRVRQSNNDPLTAFLKAKGIPNEPDVMSPDKTTVFSFPQRSPAGSVMASEQRALDQLENWLLYKKHWAEHSVSVTIYVRESEWMEVGAWVYNNFEHLTGVSFLPYSEHTYQQPPYEPISEAEYDRLRAEQPEIKWSDLREYEQEDNTEGSQTLACTAGACEI